MVILGRSSDLITSSTQYSAWSGTVLNPSEHCVGLPLSASSEHCRRRDACLRETGVPRVPLKTT